MPHSNSYLELEWTDMTQYVENMEWTDMRKIRCAVLSYKGYKK